MDNLDGKVKVKLKRCFHHLQYESGVFRCETSNVESKFSDVAQDSLFEIEDTSWWFKYRANVITKIAHKFLEKGKLGFDVGGGNGYTTYHMQEEGYAVALLEPTLAACYNAKKRGVQTVICGTLTKENVKEESIEQILLLDVLEHIEYDIEFLRTIRSKLTQGGRVLLTVPAFQTLWSSEDDSAGHYRRYRLKQLETAAREAGFSVVYINYFFEFLFLPILLVRVWMEKIGLIKRSGERTEQEKSVLQKGSSKRGRELFRRF